MSSESRNTSVAPSSGVVEAANAVMGLGSPKSLRWGYSFSVCTGLILPVAWVPILPTLLIVTIGLIRIYVFKTYRSYGKDSAISIEVMTALIVLPLTSTIVNVGTSWAFYVLGSHQTGAESTFVEILSFTLEFSVGAVGASLYLLVRHRNGRHPLAYEADVDPIEGIKELTRIRSEPAGAFFPAVYLYGSRQANQADGTLKPTSIPSMLGTIKKLVADRTTRRQALILATFGAVWILIAFTFLTRKGEWLVLIGITTSYVAIYGGAILFAKTVFYEQLRNRRRTAQLIERVSDPTPVVQQHRLTNLKLALQKVWSK